ncbi:MAG: hypothetical protein EA355_15335 [Rhodobacteraceae bacterium]|nr:MAG: hypothetical protein EA355_15335 [Paracoccaceae bacterium]
MTAEPGRRTPCGRRALNAGETPVADLAPDAFEQTMLAMMRHVFGSFAHPPGHGWLRAAALAEQRFADRQPGALFLGAVRVVQGIRCARRSPLVFSNPDCDCCAAILTEPERHLMQALMAVRRARPGVARTHAMLLCEGGDIEPLIRALGALPTVRRLSPAVG